MPADRPEPERAIQTTVPVAGTSSEPVGEELLLAEVAVDCPGRDRYSYLVPDELAEDLQAGDGVEVPFGPRRERAFVISLSRGPRPDFVLKQIIRRLDGVRIPDHLLKLIAWASGYYRVSMGEFLAGAVPAPVRQGKKPRVDRFVRRLPDFSGTLTARQQEVLARLPGEQLGTADACRLAGCDMALLRRLVKAGALALEERKGVQEVAVPVAPENHPLTDEQAVVVESVWESCEAGGHDVFFCYGVTGSGKTLAYMSLAERVIARRQQVLLLLPEIGLTPQLAARFRQRFNDVVVLHSGFTDGERAELWRRIAAGQVPLVIGTRSALFAPLPDIGLIIVDEEHDQSYKQETLPRYQARDMAVMYARQLSVPVLLGSATPSLETYHNVQAGRYRVLTMRQRPAGGRLPAPVVVDMAEEHRRANKLVNLSEELLGRLRGVQERGEQAIVLLNRRGWSPIVTCLSCGETVTCPHCDISLTYHRGHDQLRCHYCGHWQPLPQQCPACAQPDLTTKGMGTERLAAELQEAIPALRILRVDADTVATRQGHAKLLQQFAAGEADCLVGTQMVAKGLDFPRVTLVGIVAADQGLHIPDFRAAERTYQLIAQVAGRAGRGERPGMVVVQCYDTEAAAITCALNQKPRTFYTRELDLRREYGYPPGCGLLRVLWRGPDLAKVQQLAQTHGEMLRQAGEGMPVLGPVPSGISYIKGQHRWHALVKGGSRGQIQAFCDRLEALGGLKPKGEVKVALDVDPYSIT